MRRSAHDTARGRLEKFKIVKKTVDVIKASGGRFVRQLRFVNEKTRKGKACLYEIVDDVTAIEKTKQAFRYCVHHGKNGETVSPASEQNQAVDRTPGMPLFSSLSGRESADLHNGYLLASDARGLLKPAAAQVPSIPFGAHPSQTTAAYAPPQPHPLALELSHFDNGVTPLAVPHSAHNMDGLNVAIAQQLIMMALRQQQETQAARAAPVQDTANGLTVSQFLGLSQLLSLVSGTVNDSAPPHIQEYASPQVIYIDHVLQEVAPPPPPIGFSLALPEMLQSAAVANHPLYLQAAALTNPQAGAMANIGFGIFASDTAALLLSAQSMMMQGQLTNQPTFREVGLNGGFGISLNDTAALRMSAQPSMMQGQPTHQPTFTIPELDAIMFPALRPSQGWELG
jgi:hypothetical protein